MRMIYNIALLIAATSMSGCVSQTFNSLSNLSTGCVAAATSVNCSPTSVAKTGTGTGTTGPTTTTTTGTSTTTTTTVNTGNNATLTAGDTTIILEGSTVQSLINKPAGVSALKGSPLDPAFSGNSTADQQIWFNTNTASNPNWPISKTMQYSQYDSCVYESTTAGQMTIANRIDTANPGQCLTDSHGQGGKELGGNYKLYRFYNPATYDEELQVWSWNQSYATQYRDVTASGTDPQHQAWSFGGNYTPAANVPTSGAPVTYTGKWTATAKTTNFGEDTTSLTVPKLDAAGNVMRDPLTGVVLTKTLSQTVTPTNNWRVVGNSTIVADFANAQLQPDKSRLSSTSWQGVDKDKNLYNVDPLKGAQDSYACANLTAACNTNTQAGQDSWQNWVNWNYSQQFMNTDVVLNGTITTDAKNKLKPNQIIGNATMDKNNGWITDPTNNPMYGGLFGTRADGNPQEITGAFGLFSTITQPNGGSQGINNDTRRYIQMSGIFNAQ